MKFDVYSSSSDGWIRVPLRLLHELAIVSKISEHSRISGSNAYLKEGKDMSTFKNAMTNTGRTVTTNPKRKNPSYMSRIKKHDSFNTYADEFDEDFHYNVPLIELDRVELSRDGKFYEVHRKGGILESSFRFHKPVLVGPSMDRFRSTKTLRYLPPYLVIR